MLTQKQLYLTKVFIQIFLRNKQYIIFSLILPMVILGIVAFNEGDEDPIDIGIVDKSNTILSQQFISRLSENNLFNIIIKNDNSLKDDLISGKLKASHNCINLEAFSDASLSIAPPRCLVLFAIIPTGLPSILANDVIMFFANPPLNSKTEFSSKIHSSIFVTS